MHQHMGIIVTLFATLFLYRLPALADDHGLTPTKNTRVTHPVSVEDPVLDERYFDTRSLHFHRVELNDSQLPTPTQGGEGLTWLFRAPNSAHCSIIDYSRSNRAPIANRYFPTGSMELARPIRNLHGPVTDEIFEWDFTSVAFSFRTRTGARGNLTCFVRGHRWIRLSELRQFLSPYFRVETSHRELPEVSRPSPVTNNRLTEGVRGPRLNEAFGGLSKGITDGAYAGGAKGHSGAIPGEIRTPITGPGPRAYWAVKPQILENGDDLIDSIRSSPNSGWAYALDVDEVGDEELFVLNPGNVIHNISARDIPRVLATLREVGATLHQHYRSLQYEQRHRIR